MNRHRISPGIVILLCMAAMGAYLFLLSAGPKRRFNDYNFLFWMEWVAWAFAAAWLTKGRHLCRHCGRPAGVPGELLRKHE